MGKLLASKCLPELVERPIVLVASYLTDIKMRSTSSRAIKCG